MKNDKKIQTRQKNQYNWTQFDKSKAVAAYSVTGSYSKAASLTGIPEMTIRYWGRQDWFADELRRADQAETEELKSVYTRIAKKAAIELEDRLERGDEVVTKDGEVIQKRVAAKDLAIITGIAADQRRKQMDAPVTAPTQSSDEKLANLMREFIRFAKAKEVKDDPQAIDAEIMQGESDVSKDFEVSTGPDSASEGGTQDSGGATEGSGDTDSASDDTNSGGGTEEVDNRASVRTVA